MSSQFVLCSDCKNYSLCVNSGRVQYWYEPICENFAEVTCVDCRTYEYCKNVDGVASDDTICEYYRYKKVVQNG